MSYYYPQSAVKLRILPEDFQLSSDATLQTPYEVMVQAKKVTVNNNDFKTADTFSLEIDYKNFPFDPRVIRACGVVIYMQDMGQGGQTLVPDQSNIVFSGFVDTETINLDDSNQKVSFEGRDFTALLLDQKYVINKPISEQQPLDQAIKNFISQVPALSTLKIVNQTGDTLPSLAAFYPDHASPLNGQRNPGSKETYWSMIQDACHRAGIICFMDLDTITLANPRNQAETIASDIRFVYGKNIRKLELKRKLGRLKNINIQVRCRVGKNVLIAKIPFEANQSWCTAFGIPKAEVQIPQIMPTGLLNTSSSVPSSSPAPSPSPTTTPPYLQANPTIAGASQASQAIGVQTQLAPYITFNVHNVNTHAQLVLIGQSIYEQYSLQTLDGSLSTKEMTGWSIPGNVTGVFGDQLQNKGTVSGGVTQYDLTQLDTRQNIAILIDADDLAAISNIATIGAREQYLVKHGYIPAVAAIFAKTLGKISSRFYVKSCSKTMDSDNGFQLDIQFINILDTSQAGAGAPLAGDNTSLNAGAIA